MLLIVPHRHLLARVRVAVLAQVWAGVVFADVFADYAAAKLTLTFVAVVFFLGDFYAFNCVIYLNSKIIHQNFVIFCKPYHQIVVNAFVVLDAKLGDVNFFATGRKLKVPFFV